MISKNILISGNPCPFTADSSFCLVFSRFSSIADVSVHFQQSGQNWADLIGPFPLQRCEFSRKHHRAHIRWKEGREA